MDTTWVSLQNMFLTRLVHNFALIYKEYCKPHKPLQFHHHLFLIKHWSLFLLGVKCVRNGDFHFQERISETLHNFFVYEFKNGSACQWVS